jgi:hypothetical protein
MVFKPGGGGRPAGVRNRFSHAFMTDFLADWEQHGAAAIKTCGCVIPAAICAPLRRSYRRNSWSRR